MLCREANTAKDVRWVNVTAETKNMRNTLAMAPKENPNNILLFTASPQGLGVCDWPVKDPPSDLPSSHDVSFIDQADIESSKGQLWTVHHTLTHSYTQLLVMQIQANLSPEGSCRFLRCFHAERSKTRCIMFTTC